MKKFAAAALLTAVSAMSTTAQAAPIAMNGAFGVTTMSNGTYSTTFSGKSFLPADYLVNALTFSFSFKDDASDAWTTSSPTIDKTTKTGYAYESGIFNIDYVRDVTVEQTVKKTGEKESAQLSIGGIQVGQGATGLVESSSVGSGTKRVFDYDDCWIFCDTYYSEVKTVTTTLTQDWKGAFTISGTVTNQQIIDKLLADDNLLVSLNVTGDLVLTGAQLLLDYKKVDPSPVPEPSTILLALAGLGGLGYARRRAVRA